jgi:hypothetical protein
MATPPAAGFDLWGALTRTAGSNAYKLLFGEPAPGTRDYQSYQQGRELQSRLRQNALDNLSKPDPTPQQQATATLIQGDALQTLQDRQAQADLARRRQMGDMSIGWRDTLERQNTQSLGDRTRINDVSFANRTNTLTQAELQKLDAVTRNKRALLDPMLAHEAETQMRQLGFGENLVSSVLGSVDRINQMAYQDAERQRSWGNPQNVMGLLGNIAAIGSLFI